MRSKEHLLNSVLRTLLRGGLTGALAIGCVLSLILAQTAQGQTYEIIYNFTGGLDGAHPEAGLSTDAAGNLYGTSCGKPCVNGLANFGTVFRLSKKGSGWVFNVLHRFSGDDGAYPMARVVFGPDSTLYGTTFQGGAYGVGTVFNLRPQATICKTAVSCPWTEIVLHSFDVWDGINPAYGDLTFDPEGNIYGVTYYGGVYELTHSGAGWVLSVLDSGVDPFAGVIFDDAGNLYGTSYYGGTVFKLTYSPELGWTETVLYRFQGGSDGSLPVGIMFDSSGSLYGATATGGDSDGGTVFKLSPSPTGWNYALVYSFTRTGGETCGPTAAPVVDNAGNLYGTTLCNGVNRVGNVFKLTPSGDRWTYTSLHDFTQRDGVQPWGAVTIDANGTLYGTAELGGAYGYGVVWEIIP